MALIHSPRKSAQQPSSRPPSCHLQRQRQPSPAVKSQRLLSMPTPPCEKPNLTKSTRESVRSVPDSRLRPRKQRRRYVYCPDRFSNLFPLWFVEVNSCCLNTHSLPFFLLFLFVFLFFCGRKLAGRESFRSLPSAYTRMIKLAPLLLLAASCLANTGSRYERTLKIQERVETYFYTLLLTQLAAVTR